MGIYLKLQLKNMKQEMSPTIPSLILLSQTAFFSFILLDEQMGCSNVFCKSPCRTFLQTKQQLKMKSHSCFIALLSGRAI